MHKSWLRKLFPSACSATASQAKRNPRRRSILRLEALESRIVPFAVTSFSYVVTGMADVSGLTPTAGSGTSGDPFLIGSLRSAIEQANSDGHTGTDSLLVPQGTYALTLGSELDVTTSIRFKGDITGTTIIDGNQTSRVFNIQGGFSTILDVTIQNGNFQGAAGADAFGGGILVSGGTLTLTESTVAGNKVIGGTGITLNTTPSGHGGGLANTGGTLVIINCTVAGNTALGGAGFSGGKGLAGGAEGGGVYASKFTVIENSTIAFNSAVLGSGKSGGEDSEGGGLYNETPNDGDFQVGSSIMAKNTAVSGPDASSAGGVKSFMSLGWNLLGNGSNSDGFNLATDQRGTNGNPIDPKFAATTPQKFGGPTATLALLPGSPAIDQGTNLGGEPNDQRGLARTVDLPNVPNADGGDGTDIGAFEAIESHNLVTLRAGNILDFFSSALPNVILREVPVTGLLTGENLLSIDVRDSNGLLYAVSSRNRIFVINQATGAANLVGSLAVGPNDGNAISLANSLGLYVDIPGGYLQGMGSSPKWLQGAMNDFGNPWYFITPGGDFFAWDGMPSASGKLLATFGTYLFQDPKLITGAFTVTLSAPQATEAQTLEDGLGLYVDPRGFFESSGAKWLRGVPNANGNVWYIILPSGDFVAYDLGPKPGGAPLFHFDPAVYLHPDLILKSSTAALTVGQATQAQTVDSTQGLYPDRRGYFEGKGGPKWIRSTLLNSQGTFWYIIKPNGDLLEYDKSPTPTGKFVFNFGVNGYLHPELIFDASTTALSGFQATLAQSLDEKLGFYEDARGVFEDNAATVKWIRGANNAQGNPWYIITSTGDLLAYDGSAMATGTLLGNFGSAAFLNPDLLIHAFSFPFNPGTLTATTSVSMDFSPITDQLRIVTSNGQNFQNSVPTGHAVVNTSLAYTGANAGTPPNIVAIAYNNNFSGAGSTTLYGIDTSRDTLETQNETTGILTDVGALGVTTLPFLERLAGFDILGAGNSAFAVLHVNGRTRLYTINLTTGAASEVNGFGVIGSLDAVFALAALGD